MLVIRRLHNDILTSLVQPLSYCPIQARMYDGTATLGCVLRPDHDVTWLTAVKAHACDRRLLRQPGVHWSGVLPQQPWSL